MTRKTSIELNTEFSIIIIIRIKKIDRPVQAGRPDLENAGLVGPLKSTVNQLTKSLSLANEYTYHPHINDF
jgi:hypothetical protein